VHTFLYLFDIDGTILLSGGASSRALERVFFERYGVRRGFEGISAAGKTDPMILGEMFAVHLGRAPQPEEVEFLLAEYIPHLRRELATSPGFHLMPHVPEILDYLARRGDVMLGIATGNVRLAAQAKLERAGLWERFALGGYGCDYPERARLVARAIERAVETAGRQFAREEVVVIGDTQFDVAAARACGVRAVAVATGPGIDRAKLAAAEPDVLLNDLSELAAWMEAGGVATF
jgi:phosphoglycolate phosphatase-like HAD superfamily hydrolase